MTEVDDQHLVVGGGSDVVPEIRATVAHAGIEVIGPAPCFIRKSHDRFYWQILLRGADVHPILPEVPLPTKIRTRFLEPIELDSDPERAEDREYVTEMYEEIEGHIQRGMDALARQRRLPLFG